MKRAGITSEDIEPTEKDEEYIPDEEKAGTSKGQKRKSFRALGPKMKKLRLKPILDHVKEFVKEEDDDLEVGETIALIGKDHANSEADRSKAKIYEKILQNQNPFEKQEMSVHQAVALKVWNLSTVWIFTWNHSGYSQILCEIKFMW